MTLKYSWNILLQKLLAGADDNGLHLFHAYYMLGTVLSIVHSLSFNKQQFQEISTIIVPVCFMKELRFREANN